MRYWLAVLLLLIWGMAGAAPDDPEYDSRRILGWVEATVLAPDGPAIRFKSKLDTGAGTSSLHATAIEPFERDGERWVRFDVPLTDHLDVDADALAVERLTFERPISRTVRITSSGNPDGEMRYVVYLAFCLGGEHYRAEFTLADRSSLLYPVLIGRDLLEERIVVDSAYSFLAPRGCDHTDAASLEPEAAVDPSPEESD